MMKTKIIFTLVITILFQHSIFSQKEQYNIAIMGVPQYLFLNGIRVDIDKNLKGTNRWIVFSPQLYNAKSPAISEITFREYDIDKVEGAGMGVAYKYLFSDKSNIQGVYLSAGGSYNYFQIRTEAAIWEPITEGSTQLIQREGMVDATINKIGVHSVIGLQKKVMEDFLADFFIGFGIRLSFDDTSDDCITDLSTFYGDYAFSGISLVAGIRVGLGF